MSTFQEPHSYILETSQKQECRVSNFSANLENGWTPFLNFRNGILKTQEWGSKKVEFQNFPKYKKEHHFSFLTVSELLPRGSVVVDTEQHKCAMFIIHNMPSRNKEEGDPVKQPLSHFSKTPVSISHHSRFSCFHALSPCKLLSSTSNNSLAASW